MELPADEKWSIHPEDPALIVCAGRIVAEAKCRQGRTMVLATAAMDCLPDAHPLAFEGVFCCKCKDLLHAANNETMQTWVEDPTPNLPDGLGRCWCLDCFAQHGKVLETVA